MAEAAENLNQDVAVKPQLTGELAIVHDESDFAMLLDSAKFNQAWRAATMFSKSKLVPATFQGAPESCFVAMHMAVRLNLDPMMVMQKTYIVHGRPGMEAQLVIALVNARGPFKGPIQWEVTGQGDNRQWTAYAIHRGTGERCEATVTWDMVKQEGWNKDKEYKSGSGVQKSKWNTIPDLMGRYRSATFLARLFCPEVIMGLSTVDELQDLDIIDVTPEPIISEPKETKVAKIKGKLAHKPQDAATTDPSPEAQAEKTSPATATTAGQKKIIEGITPHQLEDLEKVPLDILEEGYKALKIDAKLPLNELDQKTAADLQAWLRSK